MPPQKGLPDMVFTANAALVSGRVAFLCNFRHKERQGEAEHFARWLEEHSFVVQRLPGASYFEGEGDALFCGETLFCGYRIRSDVRSHEYLAEKLDCLAISLDLVNDRFYHVDTCFCPLPDGRAFYFPARSTTTAGGPSSSTLRSIWKCRRMRRPTSRAMRLSWVRTLSCPRAVRISIADWRAGATARIRCRCRSSSKPAARASVWSCTWIEKGDIVLFLAG